jgi:hypothetical protein
MNAIRSFAIGAVLCATLIGCASITILPTTERYQQSNEEAIVLVGTISDSPSILIGTGKHIINEVALVATQKGGDVFALRVPLGQEFAIYTTVYVGGSHRYRFPDPFTLKISKPGIYYYGTLEARDTPRLSPKESPGHIALARRKYPGVFGQLQPENFR